MATDDIPLYTPFFGVMGAAAAMVFSGMYLRNLSAQDDLVLRLPHCVNP